MQLGSPELSEEELASALAEMDCDSSGLVDYAEFLPWWRLRGLRTVFVKHDKDGSGNIDATEFGNVMAELGVTLTPKELADALQPAQRCRARRTQPRRPGLGLGLGPGLRLGGGVRAAGLRVGAWHP